MSEENENSQAENLKELRKLADKGREAERLQRELAFAKAGIDTDSKLGKMFFMTYDGDLDKAAILKEAEDIPGLLMKSEPTTPPVASAPKTDETDVRLGLAGAAAPSNALPDENPFITAMNRFNEERQSGVAPELAFGAALEVVLGAHAAGDARVIPRS